MSLTAFTVVVDCRGPRSQAAFWAEALSGRVSGRLHLDQLTVGPMEPEVARLVAAGARLVEVRRDPSSLDNPDTWSVMTDPEGNEFCVTSSLTLTGWDAGSLLS
jgi:hypothetical protein